MNERALMQAVANAEAGFQMSRRFARGLKLLTPMQQDVIRALLFNAALNAIEAWEKGRPSRESIAFYEGKS